MGAPLAPDTTYTIAIANIQDTSGSVVTAGPGAAATVSYHLPPVVISEVMYNSAGADVEWIELHNTTRRPAAIGGWYLTDDSQYPATGEGDWVLPEGATIAPFGYALVALTPDQSAWRFPAGVRIIQPTVGNGGQLDNAGDNLALFDGADGGVLVDGSLAANFPDLAASGQSLEKTDDDFPWRSHPLAWRAAQVGLGWTTEAGTRGSPGRRNGVPYSGTAVRHWRFY